MLRSLTQRQQERVWELWREGRSAHAIGRELGTYYQYVLRCLHVTGGIKPPPRRRAQCQLSISEREEISRGLARGDSFRTIARAIARPHTTVAREVNRNGGRTRYRAGRADECAWKRARRPKPAMLTLNARLRAVVEQRLAELWSPEQISRWLRRTYPDDASMQVSHETIYLSLFVQSRGALRKQLTAHLRSGRQLRRPRANRSKRQGQGKTRT